MRFARVASVHCTLTTTMFCHNVRVSQYFVHGFCISEIRSKRLQERDYRTIQSIFISQANTIEKYTVKISLTYNNNHHRHGAQVSVCVHKNLLVRLFQRCSLMMFIVRVEKGLLHIFLFTHYHTGTQKLAKIHQ